MQRNFVSRSHSKPNRWMYIPPYRPRIEINLGAIIHDLLIGGVLGGLLVVVMLKVFQGL